MFNFFANIFGYVLNIIYNVVNNYGIAIIIFTVLLKLIMLPISIKQQKTMKKTSKIQQQAKEIQEKYSNDQVRQSQELMELYKRENMSPFSGCLSSIVQFIIIISVFYLVSRPLTYMKQVDKDLLNKYSTEITESSENRINYPEIAVIKEKGKKDDRVNINMNFLGLDLSDVPSQNYKNWKVYVIPALYIFTSIISTKLTMKMNKSNTKETDKDKEKEKAEVETDTKEQDAMEEMNKQMLFMMPFIAVSVALIAPLGLALYWFISNLLMIFERIIINKVVKEEEEV